MARKKSVARKNKNSLLLPILIVIALIAVIVIFMNQPQYSAKQRIVAEGGSGSGAMVDLTIINVASSLTNVEGQPYIELVYLVKNIGNYPITQGVSGWCEISNPDGGSLGQSQSILCQEGNNCLEVGEVVEFSCNIPLTSAGYYTYSIEVDPNNIIIENNEANNIQSGTINSNQLAVTYQGVLEMLNNAQIRNHYISLNDPVNTCTEVCQEYSEICIVAHHASTSNNIEYILGCDVGVLLPGNQSSMNLACLCASP